MESMEANAVAVYLFFKGSELDLSEKKFNSYLEKQWPNSPAMHELRKKNDQHSFVFGDETLGTLTTSKSAYPWEELEVRCQTAWWWEDAEKSLKGHKSHAVITLFNDQVDPVMLSTHLTALTCALIQATKPIAVLWGNGEVLHSAETFLEIAELSREEDPSLPLSLWVDFQLLFEEGDQQSLYSYGLESLGFPDLEIHSAKGDPSDLMTAIQSIAIYMVGNNIEFQDDETIGLEGDKPIRLHYGESLLGEEREVLILDV